MEKNYDRRNRYCFGLGTIGRDMLYTMVSMYIIFFFTDVINVPNATLSIMTTVLMVLGIFDAFNDPMMGLVVDNSKSRFGKFKPWMLIGAIIGGVCVVLMFFDWGLTGVAYVAVIAVLYLIWDVFYGLNDIAYWSMMPALSTDQKQREKIGSFARICADVGLFSVAAGIVPITSGLAQAMGSLKQSWFTFAVAVAVLMLAFQAVTLIFVKERKGYFKQEEKTSIRAMFRVLYKTIN